MNGTIFETIQYPHRLCMYLTIVDYPKDPDQVFHITLWLVLLICGYISNGLFLLTILNSQYLRRSVMNRLLLVLSVIDILILTNELVYIMYPFIARDTHWKEAFGTPLVVGPVWFYTLFEHFSEGVLIVIAYERFRAICFPFQILRKGVFLVKSLSIVVVVSILFTAGYAYMFYYGHSKDLGVFLPMLLVGPFVIPFLINLILYSFVIYTMYSSAKDTAVSTKMGNSRARRNRRQVVVVLSINTFVYFILNALRKYFDTRLAQAFNANSSTNPGHSQYDFIEDAWHWASYMALCMIVNSAVNPIIYNMGSNQYRQEMFKTVCRAKRFAGSTFNCNKTTRQPAVYLVSSSQNTKRSECLSSLSMPHANNGFTG